MFSIKITIKGRPFSYEKIKRVAKIKDEKLKTKTELTKMKRQDLDEYSHEVSPYEWQWNNKSELSSHIIEEYSEDINVPKTALRAALKTMTLDQMKYLAITALYSDFTKTELIEEILLCQKAKQEGGFDKKDVNWNTKKKTWLK